MGASLVAFWGLGIWRKIEERLCTLDKSAEKTSADTWKKACDIRDYRENKKRIVTVCI